jgi:hypothetical protein
MASKAGLPHTNTCKSRYQSGTIEFDIVCVFYEGIRKAHPQQSHVPREALGRLIDELSLMIGLQNI